jgi:hypothetical protein
MKIQSVKGVLLGITASMGFILVLMPQVAFSQIPFGAVILKIDAPGNSCTFLDIDGSETVTVNSPDSLKVVKRGKKPAEATCKDDTLTNDEVIIFEGLDPMEVLCYINTNEITDWIGSFKQTIDQHGTTLTCKGEIATPDGPQGVPCPGKSCDHKK